MMAEQTGGVMLKRISVLALALLCTGCPNSAGDCHNTLSCEPVDAGPAVVYVASDAGVECNGVCVPGFADIGGWSAHPFMLWQGPIMKIPTTQCPQNISPTQLWYSIPEQASMSCPTCSCNPSTGMCMLPDTMTLSASPVCPSDVGDAGVPLDPPSSWDGGCNTNDAIVAADCDGGSCLAVVGPMIPVNTGCTPTQAVVPKNLTWTLAAYGCAGSTNGGTCKDPGQVCAPTPPSLDGFSICVSRQGDDSLLLCPPGYPSRSVYYLSGDDTRGCSACECGPPEGDVCSSLVSFYSDDACSVQAGSVMSLSSGPTCVSIPTNAPLGSKQASAPIYSPGTCQAGGGEPTGFVKPLDPFTFCCRQ